MKLGLGLSWFASQNFEKQKETRIELGWSIFPGLHLRTDRDDRFFPFCSTPTSLVSESDVFC